MGQILTLAVLLAAAFVILLRLRGANRRARDASAAKDADAAKRKEKEREILDRLGRMREKKDDLESAKGAIQNDPVRAAKVVSKMMREKK